MKLESSRAKFNAAQIAGLEQRLSLLTAFLAEASPALKTAKKPNKIQSPRFRAGQITIIDLSDPFLDTASACGLFEIIVRQFIRADVATGKVLVVDEAHKVRRLCSYFISSVAYLSVFPVSICREVGHRVDKSPFRPHSAAEAPRHASYHQHARLG